MHLTVEQALTIYPLSEGRLIAGAAGKYRIVKSVNVMDAPDISEWIKEGEMLFTTAYLMKDSMEDAIRLLRTLNEKGSSGIGIKLGRFLEEVPEAMKEEADRLAFPIIELPYRFTFSDQMNGLFEARLQRDTESLRSVLQKQKRLMRFALASDPIKKLFDAVADIIGYPMAVINAQAVAIYNTTSFSESQLLKGWPWKRHYQWVNSSGMHYVRIPLTHREEHAGFVLFFPDDEHLIKAEEGLFHQAAELLSHHMSYSLQDYMGHSVHAEFGSALISYLLKGESPETLLQAAKRLERNPLQSTFQCVYSCCRGVGSEMSAKALQQLSDMWSRTSSLRRLGGIHVRMPEGMLSIFPVEPDTDTTFKDSLESSLQQIQLPPHLRIYASLPKRKAESVKDAYRECLEAKKLAERLAYSETVVFYEKVEFASLLQHVPEDRMRLYCDDLLGPLTSKDPEYAQEMLHTLEVFVENDGQLNETAKRLFIHRNTATYRMEKLGELLNLDTKKVNDIMRLKIAFLFRRMLGAEGLKK
jgi:purine catabolism regulator